MTTYYEVLRPVEQADLDTSPMLADVLGIIPPRGRVTFEAFRHVKNRRATRGIAHACSIGVLRRVPPCDRAMSLDSVQFWLTQLNKSGHRNTTPTQNTKTLYLQAISNLDEWLPGRTFPSYRTVVSGGQVERQAITKSFKNVEELLGYCNESDHGTKAAQRVAREYLASPRVAGASASVQTITRSAIKSYFKKHDIVPDIPNTGMKRDGRAPSETAMTLENRYRMLQNGRPSLKESKAKVEVLEKRVNELEAEIGKKDARSAGAESRFDAAVKAIIDALDDPGGDLRKNIRDRLGGL